MVGFLTSSAALARIRRGLASFVGLALFLLACTSQAIPLEEQAQAIDRTLMCPVCPSETINQSQVPLAFQMRQRVRDMLAEGASREEINEHFIARYGEEVLASPPKGGANLTAWIVPPVGLLVGAIVLGFAIRAMRRSPGLGDEDEEVTEAELASYLERVDSEMGTDVSNAESSGGISSDGSGSGNS
ncbi:MAG: cytochrome c-type biogenesis protein CcmH [Chloroflexi bacterium]|nr:MAG: cytochrome c-type biogenesis protein CcmH [Chloroflexota bacterium]